MTEDTRGESLSARGSMDAADHDRAVVRTEGSRRRKQSLVLVAIATAVVAGVAGVAIASGSFEQPEAPSAMSTPSQRIGTDAEQLEGTLAEGVANVYPTATENGDFVAWQDFDKPLEAKDYDKTSFVTYDLALSSGGSAHAYVGASASEAEGVSQEGCDQGLKAGGYLTCRAGDTEDGRRFIVATSAMREIAPDRWALISDVELRKDPAGTKIVLRAKVAGSQGLIVSLAETAVNTPDYERGFFASGDELLSFASDTRFIASGP